MVIHQAKGKKDEDALLKKLYHILENGCLWVRGKEERKSLHRERREGTENTEKSQIALCFSLCSLCKLFLRELCVTLFYLTSGFWRARCSCWWPL